MTSAVSPDFEELCQKEFHLERKRIYEDMDHDASQKIKWYAGRNAAMSREMAQDVVDILLKHFDRILTAFDSAFLGKWNDPAKELSPEELEWLNGKANSVLEEEVRNLGRTCNGKLWERTCSLTWFWEQAEAKARQKKVDFSQEIEILRLKKSQSGVPKPARPISPIKAGFDAWDQLHPRVAKVARSRFESGHFADAVEAALKELNEVIKTIVRKRTGLEYDGGPLMHFAFSPKKPVIEFGTQNTETDRNIQQGYMEIFAGAMIGVRNPKAHSNVVIDSKRAIHFLFLASLLFFKIDEALANSTANGVTP